MGCASLQTQTPYPLCEVLSGRICLVNGTQVSGLDCVCLARGLCLFSLRNGPQLSAAAWPEIIGSQWAGVEAQHFLHFFFFFIFYCGDWAVDELEARIFFLMKFKTSHNTMLRLHIEQTWFFLDSSSFLYSSLSLRLLWSPPAKQAFEVVKALALLLSPQSAYVTGREKLEGSNVTPT